MLGISTALIWRLASGQVRTLTPTNYNGLFAIGGLKSA